MSTEPMLPASPAVAPAAVPVATPPEAQVSLDEFCARHSLVEGPEMLGAFFAMEGRKPSNHRALPSEFLARLKAFANRPVG